MTPPSLIAAYEPVRAELRPPECHGAGAGPCWVTAPYEAINPGKGIHCSGCRGKIRRSPLDARPPRDGRRKSR